MGAPADADDSEETIPLATKSAHTLAPGVVFDGRFILEQSVGQGSFSTVWEVSVVGASPSPRLALKVVPAVHRVRVLREGAIMRSLSGPHFVREHESGVVGEIAYVLMDLLEGEDLQSKLTRQSHLTISEVLELARQLAVGLGEAHAMGFVHRDLKPSNLILTTAGTWKLLDFGVAKDPRDERRLTASNTLLGSPAYMAPEQISNAREVDARADLWSIACVLYVALTGKRAFEGAGAALLASILASPHRPPSSHLPSLNPAVDAVFERALAKPPEARYPTMLQLAEALAGAIAG
ncbi:MAG: serine/threonine-protein kinase [Polyangiaceae bacterium]